MHLDALDLHGHLFGLGATERAAQIQAQIAVNQIEQIEARRATAGADKTSGTRREMQDIEVFVQYGIGRRVMVDDPLAGAHQCIAGGALPCRRHQRPVGWRPCRDGKGGMHTAVGIYLLEHAEAAFHRCEQLGMPRDVFCIAQKQVATRLERKMEDRNHPVLQFCVEINQQVTARHQIQPREWRVFDDAVLREHAQLAQFLAHHVGVALLDEPAA